MFRRVFISLLMCMTLLFFISGCKEETKIPQTTKDESETPMISPTESPTEAPTEKQEKVLASPTPDKVENGYVVVLDAGHQAKQNKELEPIGPGAKTTKKKVSSGTRGRVTGLYEYELDLTVAKKLQALLVDRGYKVIMTRESHDVNISNVERAKIANEANADAVIRIHANGSDNKEKQGISTVCISKKNPYNADIYLESHALSECVIKTVIESTEANNRGVWETDTMTGLNWSEVPTTIIEMGYMSNAKEDQLLATEDYQDKLAKGMADGLDAYFSKQK